MSFWEQLLRTKQRNQIRAAAVANGQPLWGSPPQTRPLEEVLAALLETWDQRYAFELDREAWRLSLNTSSFELHATEGGDGAIVLAFERAGKPHEIECSVDEAPKLIETLLFG
jgi:hypothetical protein